VGHEMERKDGEWMIGVIEAAQMNDQDRFDICHGNRKQGQPQDGSISRKHGP
jgi:hypothetical protein